MGLVCSVCAMLLKELGWRAAPIFASVSALAIITLVLPEINNLTSGVVSALTVVGASDAARAVLKIIGIGYLCGICSDVCKDIGSERVGVAISLAGRVEIALIALPYVTQMLKLGLELVE